MSYQELIDEVDLTPEKCGKYIKVTEGWPVEENPDDQSDILEHHAPYVDMDGELIDVTPDAPGAPYTPDQIAQFDRECRIWTCYTPADSYPIIVPGRLSLRECALYLSQLPYPADKRKS